MATSASTLNTAAPRLRLPDFHLLCMQEEASEAFKTAVQTLFPDIENYINITHHNCSLKHLDKDLRFSAVVSPANSYARLDGAYDDALARSFGRGDYDWITRKAQAVLYEKWRGYAPPGTCTLVRLDHHTLGDAAQRNPWGSEYLLLCPTMRIPWDVTWDREVVYECVWSLLCAVDVQNRKIREAGAGAIEREIKSILMTPLATGCGRISNTQWAEQCVLAMKYWVEAVEKPEIWSRMTWEDVLGSGRHEELCETCVKLMGKRVDLSHVVAPWTCVRQSHFLMSYLARVNLFYQSLLVFETFADLFTHLYRWGGEDDPAAARAIS